MWGPSAVCGISRRIVGLGFCTLSNRGALGLGVVARDCVVGKLIDGI